MPNRPWSPAEAEQKLADLVDVLGEAVTDLRQVSFEAAVAEHDFKLAEAKAFTTHRAGGVAQEEAKRRALLEAQEEHRTYLINESVARASYKHIDVLKSQCDALRSLLVSARGVSS